MKSLMLAIAAVLIGVPVFLGMIYVVSETIEQIGQYQELGRL